MVSSVTSYSRNGLRDWLVQRLTALILGVYAVIVLGFMWTHAPLEFDVWRALYSQLWMKLFTVLALFSLLAHAWIGLWTVFTDYIKPTAIRLVLHVVVLIGLLLCLIWGIAILWSI